MYVMERVRINLKLKNTLIEHTDAWSSGNEFV
jgi:hypothetical protein